ncbi:MAG TPA: hypothetical protein PK530_07150 [Anaerolineales bacterium]|nr:hypothetical protein [Anaerolineales bacterium]
MPKTFYTERDIEDLARRGVTSITVTDDVVLTEVAREKAERLGVALLREHDTPPSAPVRPYIAKPTQTASASRSTAPLDKVDLREKVRQAVIARLGNEVDRNLLETIITRVLDNVGVRG